MRSDAQTVPRSLAAYAAMVLRIKGSGRSLSLSRRVSARSLTYTTHTVCCSAAWLREAESTARLQRMLQCDTMDLHCGLPIEPTTQAESERPCPERPRQAGGGPSRSQPGARPQHRANRLRSLSSVHTATLLLTSAQPITARLAAAGSRRAVLDALLHAAPPDATPAQLRSLVIVQNLTGKSSTATRVQVWK
jgi:hypothetical protein